MINDLRKLRDPNKAKFLSRFFKTGPGQYGEGDKFLGITVPVIRKIAKAHQNKGWDFLNELIRSPYNEERTLALIILSHQFEKGEDAFKKQAYAFYLKNTRYINNWNLVDVSAPYIVGAYLCDRSRSILYKLAKSTSMWERRIAIVSTFYFIRQNDLEDTFKISKLLLKDEEDLLHKATGWMLREAGKKDIRQLTAFLDRETPKMPRTMLRYAIEKLPESERKYYLKLK